MNSPTSRGKAAKMRDNSGDTVKELLSSPTSTDGAGSNQVQMREPTGIKPTAIQEAGKRRLNVPLPANF